jgi:hypothetical protein
MLKEENVKKIGRRHRILNNLGKVCLSVLFAILIVNPVFAVEPLEASSFVIASPGGTELAATPPPLKVLQSKITYRYGGFICELCSDAPRL